MLALKNINSAAAKILYLNDVDIENVVLSKKQKNSKQKKDINTLLVTGDITKRNHSL